MEILKNLILEFKSIWVKYPENTPTEMLLGSVAKGYCVDWIVERLVNAGFNDCYVDWGGDIKTNGQHPDDRPWKTALIQPPRYENSKKILSFIKRL